MGYSTVLGYVQGDFLFRKVTSWDHIGLYIVRIPVLEGMSNQLGDFNRHLRGFQFIEVLHPADDASCHCKEIGLLEIGKYLGTWEFPNVNNNGLLRCLEIYEVQM